LRQLETGRAVRGAQGNQVRDAEKALADAEAAAAAGKEPRPGERIGTAGGASRLTDEYWARQKGLESGVESARRNLDAARGGQPAGNPAGASAEPPDPVR